MARRVGLGLLVMSLALAALFAFVRHRRLSQEVIDRVVAVSAPRARPVHRAPAIDSTFEAGLAPLLDEPPAWGVFGSSTALERVDVVRDVVSGVRPLSQLEAAFVEDAELPRAWVEQVVACSRATASGQVEGLGLLADRRHPRMQVSWYAPLELWGGLEVRRVLARGDRAGALRWCVDLMATGRDVTLLRAEFGVEFGLHLGKRLAAPCEEALQSASPPERAQFHGELSRVRAGVPTLREFLERRRALDGLLWWGGFLLPGELDRLPQPMRPRAGESLSGEWPRRKMSLYLAWGALEASRQAMIDAADAPDRDVRFDAELRRFRIALWATGESVSSHLIDEAHQYDQWVSQLDRLLQLSEEAP